MDNKYMCMKCKCAGAKSLVPYKIIEDRDGESVKFKGQLCDRCYKELFDKTDALAQTTEKDTNGESKQKEQG